MLMRWFVVEVSDDRTDCTIVGNCKTKEMAKQVIITLNAQSDRLFRIVGPITQNMIEGKLNPEDLALVEAQIEHIEYEQGGGRMH